MFKSLINTIRLILTCFFLGLNPAIRRKENDGNFRQGFTMSDGEAYMVVVQRSLLVKAYSQWYIPNATRYVYLASLVKGDSFDTDAISVKCYPELTPNLVKHLTDPTYPFMKVANVHIEQHFGQNDGKDSA